MTHECPYCGEFVSGYHECDAGSDRVGFECLDCGDEIGRDAHQMDLTGIAPKRCYHCVMEKMEAGR
jgi:predicted RNA-binding Zn-ribbon protein involved in translation (DUF1610 family)